MSAVSVNIVDKQGTRGSDFDQVLGDVRGISEVGEVGNVGSVSDDSVESLGSLSELLKRSSSCDLGSTIDMEG